VWLPTGTYNSRFQAVGGGGYAGNLSYAAMAGALRAGYATASTDTGHVGGRGTFALNPDSTLNNQLIEDFASRSVLQLTLKAQTLIAAFYGANPQYSYWNGCSLGGRQGMVLAQRLPGAYNGIMVGAPAISWDRLFTNSFYPYVVQQNELGGLMPACKLARFQAASVAHCDRYDGVLDGVIGNPGRCDFNPASLIGETLPCGTITQADAVAMAKIYRGPVSTDGQKFWVGFPPGASNSLMAWASPPNIILLDHLTHWVKQDPTFDWRTLTYAGFEEAFRTAEYKFANIIGSDDADLRPFKNAGGKIVMWHGLVDSLPYEQQIRYYDRVTDVFRSRTQVQQFFRMFLAPGVDHCGGGPGPNQFDTFGALVKWVENNEAPATIEARRVIGGQVVRTQPLCPYPDVAKYHNGDPSVASNYKCLPNYGESPVSNRSN
jgi:hypothetical protein